ncbi:MAG: helix-turn-helix transcriptional regulator [Holosporaceae bacterium]|nr:MAG: helix-turn-helix transcriptional regulator [Holosporaceae bacterium]
MKEKTKIKFYVLHAPFLEKKGFHGVRTQDIAQEANVNHGLIFHHFKSKRRFVASHQRIYRRPLCRNAPCPQPNTTLQPFS